MKRRACAGLAISAMAGALVSHDAAAQELVTFQPPHFARRPTATVNPALGRQVDEAAAAADPSTPDELVAFALGTTAALLHFGLGHRTRLSFDAAEREGNCVEYAELFAWILDRERGRIEARAWVVRSDAKVVGQVLPGAAWKDHDWVLVVADTPDGGTKRLYVDPTLYDVGLGWDVSRYVHGDVLLPR